MSSANEHIANMAATLKNPELQENPVRFGLDTAGQVLGTGEGLVRIRAAMKDGDVQRNVANAFYNKLGEVQNGVGSSAREALQNASGRAGQTLASASADSQSGVSSASARAVASRGAAPPTSAQVNPSAADIAAQDGGSASKISSFPQSVMQDADEANSINKGINSKINSALSGDERGALNDTIRGSLGDFNSIDQMAPGGARTQSFQNFLQAKNNIANDVLARKTGGLSPAQAYDATGKPIGQQTLSGVTTPKQSLPGQAAQADASGGARAGSNASRTVAQGEDLSQAINTLSGGGIDARGAALNLQQGSIPGRGGQALQGLTTNPSQNAQNLSLAQHSNTAAAQNANGAGSQTGNAGDSTIGGQAGTRQNQAAAAGQSADNDAATTGGRAVSSNTGSNAANGADEAGSSASRGLASALGTEETLDALAPDTGPLAPILEAGGLLATLGTGIASLFESPTKETTPKTTAPPPVTMSIGANLKNSSSSGGSVGAF